MKLDNFVPFGRPHDGGVITQFMSKLDVSNNLIPVHQYQNRLESKEMRISLRLKIACHNAHILKIYCNMYGVYLFNMLLTKFLLTQILDFLMVNKLL